MADEIEGRVEKDPEQRLRLLRVAAEQGLSYAQCELGLHYGDLFDRHRFLGEERYGTLAIHWLRKAAVQDCNFSQYLLGYLYCAGRMIKKNPEEAIYWLLKAAENGQSMAQLTLGKCYHHGEMVEKNYAQAIYWYRKCADVNGEAQYALVMPNTRWVCFITAGIWLKKT